MIFLKRCVLHAEKLCNDCGECDDRCERDPNKICDNCFRCLDEETESFAEIPVSGVFFDDDFVPDREGDMELDIDEGFVLDSDEDWKEDALFHIKTLPMTYGTRVRRSHRRD